MKIIPDWQNKQLRCYFCGETRSVKYTVEVKSTVYKDKAQRVCACNKCALIHSVNKN